MLSLLIGDVKDVLRPYHSDQPGASGNDSTGPTVAGVISGALGVR